MTFRSFSTAASVLALGLLAGGLSQCKDKASGSSGASSKGEKTLLNVSYDPTREFYSEFNQAFAKHWLESKGESVKIQQSHGGSGKQARSVADGLAADVVTLALAGDIDMLAQSQLLEADWQTKFEHNSAPYTSTIVFVVHKGNPKAIKDWSDLVTGEVQVITPNPKTSGGARWNYLAAWAWAEKQFPQQPERVQAYMKQLFSHVPVLDAGARASTTTFAQRKIGDVLISWENEAYLIQKEFPDQFDIVLPSLSILAQPPVAVVTHNAERNGNLELAQGYLSYLYSPEGQTIIAKHHFRNHQGQWPAGSAHAADRMELVNIDQHFGGWVKAQEQHFRDGGTFDQIYGAK